jgi:hypothetical protein
VRSNDQHRIRQAALTIEMDDGTWTVVRFDSGSAIVDRVYEDYRDGPALEVTGFKVIVEGPGGMAQARDFNLAWAMANGQRSPQDVREQAGLPMATPELDR